MKKSNFRIPILELVLEGAEFQIRIAVIDVEAVEVLVHAGRSDLFRVQSRVQTTILLVEAP